MILLAIVAATLFFTSDLDRVESEMERLIELALKGGDEAADEILDAFAEDYRGTGWFSRKSIEGRLRSVLVPPERLSALTHGDLAPIAIGSEIKIPIVSLRATIGGTEQRVLLAITFAQREGHNGEIQWKIVEVTRWRMGDR